MKFRPVALYLPQYHPIPENDLWWGKGFTEWTNVVKARPLFKGHYQPQLPADLGFYDLRLPEAREAQAAYARSYGIYGFCYYYYWFNGRTVLERPVNEVLRSGKPEFPFMLCWANENWTRRWDGLESEILLKQEHSDQDDVSIIEHLIPFFRDERYIRVNGKPVFVLYKQFLLPNASATADRWRKAARKHGLELYLCHMVFNYDSRGNILVDGFDAAIDFEPFGVRRAIKQSGKETFLEKVFRKLRNDPRDNYPVVDYRSLFSSLTSLHKFDYKVFPSLVPGWDNTPRRLHNPTLILDRSEPAFFREWLSKILDDFSPYSNDENFVFINAWNEWAEGNHLEPCTRWGTQYLEAVKDVMDSTSQV